MRIWLRNIRLKKGLTQDFVAVNTSIKRPYYNMIEKGSRTPSVNVAKKIGSILGFDWTIFFTSECNETLHKEEETKC